MYNNNILTTTTNTTTTTTTTGVSVSAMLAKAVAMVLQNHPVVNAAYVEGGIKYNKGSVYVSVSVVMIYYTHYYYYHQYHKHYYHYYHYNRYQCSNGSSN